MNRRSFYLPASLLLAAALAGPSATAQDRSNEAPDAVRLTLRDALAAALENNLDIVSARIAPEVSGESVTIRDAEFDLGFQADFWADEFKREPRAQFETAGSGDSLNLSAGVQDQMRWGGDWSVQLSSNRDTGDNVPFEPFYQSGLSAVFNQPLLNGFGKEVRQEQLLLARGNLEISAEDFRVQVHNTLEFVESAYWDVKAARAGLDVAREALKRAEELLDQNRKKVEVGTLAPIEITQAEAGVASQEEGVIVAEADLRNAEDELRRLMGIPPADPMWEKPILAVDEAAIDIAAIDTEQAIETAFDHRPELLRARIDLRNRELSERVAEKNTRPTLDLRLTASPFGNNNDGQAFSPGPDGIPGTPDDEPIILPGPDGVFGTSDDGLAFNEASYDTSVSEIFELENYFWEARLTYRIPIGNRAAKASYRIAQLERERGEVDLRNQRQNIRVEVRRAARNVESGAKRIAAAQANVVLQRKNLEAEQKKFENGMSTSFQVLTFQNDLSDAELALIRALADYRKALVAFEKAKGQLLESRGFAVETAGA